MKNAVFALLVGMGIALIAVGCGGSESEAAPLTKAQFIAEADAICSQAKEERNAAMKAAGEESAENPGSDDAELERFVSDAALPSIQTMTDELGELGTPKKDKKQVEAIVAGFEDAVEQIEADPESALTPAPFVKANERATDYGLTGCVI